MSEKTKNRNIVVDAPENYEIVFDLEQFIYDNNRLLTVMGVFGGIAIYLTQISGPIELITKLGIVSCLAIFIVISILVNRNALRTLLAEFEGSLEQLVYQFVSTFTFSSISFLLFIIPFNLLAVSVLAISVNFEHSAIIIGSFFLFAVLVPVFIVGFLELWKTILDHAEGASFGVVFLLLPVGLTALGYLAGTAITSTGYSLNILPYLEVGRSISLLLAAYYSYVFAVLLFALTFAVFLGSVWMEPLGEDGGVGNPGEQAIRRGDLAFAAKYYKRDLAFSQLTRDRYSEAIALMDIGRVAELDGDPAAAREYFETSRGILRELGEDEGEADALYYLGELCRRRGEYDTAKDYSERSIELYKQSGDHLEVAVHLLARGLIPYSQGNYPAARTHLQSALEYAHTPRRETDVSDRRASIQADIHGNLGWVALREGAYATANDHFHTATDINGDRELTAIGPLGLGWVALRQGDYASAREYFDQTRAFGERIHDPDWVGQALEGLGFVDIEDEYYVSAKDTLEACRDRFAQSSFEFREIDAVTGLGWVALGEHQYPTAREHFERTVDFATDTNDPYREALGNWGLGEVSLGREEYPVAETHFREALDGFGRIGHRRGEAGSYAGLGLVAAQQGQDGDARDYLSEAHRIRSSIGANTEKTFQAIERLVDSFDERGDFDTAVQWCEFAIELGGDADAIEEQRRLFKQRRDTL